MLHPDDTFDFWFEDDAELPEAERPTFVYRYRSAREWMEFSRKRKDAAAKTDEEYLAALKAFASEGLVGWRNVRLFGGEVVEFDPSRLDEIMTLAELMDLTNSLASAATLRFMDKKKSASRSQSNGASSASTVPAASA